MDDGKLLVPGGKILEVSNIPPVACGNCQRGAVKSIANRPKPKLISYSYMDLCSAMQHGKYVVLNDGRQNEVHGTPIQIQVESGGHGNPVEHWNVLLRLRFEPNETKLVYVRTR